MACLPDDVVGLTRYDLIMAASKMVHQTDLECLIGDLHRAPKMVWPGRTFLRRMINLLCCFKDHPIWLNKEFHLDLQWWAHLLDQ